MRIVVIGGSGTIGSAIVKELCSHHDVLVATRRGGDVTVDVTSDDSIRAMFEAVGRCDAVVFAAGSVHFAPLSVMTSQHYFKGLNDKLMGQIRTVLIGQEYLQDRGSFTLISGILSDDPIKTGTSASMVNGAIDAFVKAAAIEMPRGIRINAVNPSVVTEALHAYGSYFPGFISVPAAKVAQAFSKSIEGAQTGQVYRVWS
jgi:NAD(P)-dependent dehydrogenase (short-subunit alcohol dehydrogenase family)